MENFIILLLCGILIFNFLNLYVAVSFVWFIQSRNATTAKRAVSIKSNPLFQIYLAGPLLPWSHLHKTKAGKYWYDDSAWKMNKLFMLAFFGTILFFNVFLLLFYMWQ